MSWSKVMVQAEYYVVERMAALTDGSASMSICRLLVPVSLCVNWDCKASTSWAHCEAEIGWYLWNTWDRACPQSILLFWNSGALSGPSPVVNSASCYFPHRRGRWQWPQDSLEFHWRGERSSHLEPLLSQGTTSEHPHGLLADPQCSVFKWASVRGRTSALDWTLLQRAKQALSKREKPFADCWARRARVQRRAGPEARGFWFELLSHVGGSVAFFTVKDLAFGTRHAQLYIPLSHFGKSPVHSASVSSSVKCGFWWYLPYRSVVRPGIRECKYFAS